MVHEEFSEDEIQSVDFVAFQLDGDSLIDNGDPFIV
jgi:hypothetical protein